MSPSTKKIQEGFYWTGCCHVPCHGGIDYIQGTLDRSATWKSFPVYAAASGMACSQVASTQKGCIPGVGNRVLIKTKVNGKVFYHYYGHFRSMVSRIPQGRRQGPCATAATCWAIRATAVIPAVSSTCTSSS